MSRDSLDEIAAVIQRSEVLVVDGVVTGVQDVTRTAMYVAAAELVEQMSPSRLVEVIRNGLSEAAFEGNRNLAGDLAVRILLDLASQQSELSNSNNNELRAG